MSQTYHSLLSFWKQFHVASLLEKKIPVLFPTPRRTAPVCCSAQPGLWQGRRCWSSWIHLSHWLTWHGASFEALAKSDWGQKLDANSRRKKTILSSPSHLLPDCPSLVGWLKENRKCIFVVCDRLQRSTNSIYYISAAILCMLLGMWVALMCAPLDKYALVSIWDILPVENCHQIKYQIYFTIK